MPTDSELIEKLIDATKTGRLDWQKTAVQLQYATAFGGKWLVLTDQHRNDPEVFWMTLKDSDGEVLLRIYNREDPRVQGLYEAARRRALKVDEALTDVLKELDKPQK